jgi:hypothetical protein
MDPSGAAALEAVVCSCGASAPAMHHQYATPPKKALTFA